MRGYYRRNRPMPVAVVARALGVNRAKRQTISLKAFRRGLRRRARADHMRALTNAATEAMRAAAVVQALSDR